MSVIPPTVVTEASAKPWPRATPPVTAVLVHGGWSDTSSWSRVTPLLIAEGLEVLVVRNPLTTLDAAVEATRGAVGRAEGPVVLVGHGFAGSVITQAGDARGVAALVYVGAPAPDAGESDGALVTRYPRAPAFLTAVIDDHGDAYQTADGVRDHIAPDAPTACVRMLIAAHGPLTTHQFSTPVTAPAWRRVPCWALVSEQDQVIAPDLLWASARRMHARTTRLLGGHGSPLSHPMAVAQVIADAADWVFQHTAPSPQVLAD